jgi:hypothetical protein
MMAVVVTAAMKLCRRSYPEIVYRLGMRRRVGESFCLALAGIQGGEQYLHNSQSLARPGP